MGRSKAPLIVIAAIAASILAPLAARASESQEQAFVTRINNERTSRGIGAVSVHSDLVAVARRWSAHMAAVGQISHDPNLPNEVDGWTALGDNVGRGPDVSSLHQAFMNSPEHRSIILDPSYNQVGVGVYQDGDTLWVTEIFVRRAASTVVHHVSSTPATHRTYTPRRAITQTSPGTYILQLNDVVWALDLDDLDTAPLTVSVLEQLVALDAARVDPATGDAVAGH